MSECIRIHASTLSCSYRCKVFTLQSFADTVHDLLDGGDLFFKGEGEGHGAAGEGEGAKWEFDYYLVICRKVLWQGKVRLRRHRELGGRDPGDSLHQVSVSVEDSKSYFEGGRTKG